MDRVLLDASALLAVLSSAAGATRIRSLIPRAEIGSVSLAEVASKLVEVGMPEDEVRLILDGLALRVHNLGKTTALMAADLRRHPGSDSLSLSARCSLALAIQLGLPIITADPRWKDLDLGVQVEVISAD